MDGTTDSPLEHLAKEALRLGAASLEVERRSGHEEVTAIQDCVGVGIAHLPSSSREAPSLREELHLLLRKRRHVRVDGSEYVLRGSRFEHFGDWAFRVEFRRRS